MNRPSVQDEPPRAMPSPATTVAPVQEALQRLYAALQRTRDDATANRLLLQFGLDPDLRLPGGQTLLMAAAQSDTIPLESLIAQGAPDATDNNGWTALFHAVANDNLRAARELLPRTTRLTKPSGYTALMLAAVTASVPMLELLAPRSNLADEALHIPGVLTPHTALDRAICKRNWSNAHWLIEHTPLPQARAALERAPSTWTTVMSTRPHNPVQEIASLQQRLDVRQARHDQRVLSAALNDVPDGEPPSARSRL